jgi:hypothetical protein
MSLIPRDVRRVCLTLAAAALVGRACCAQQTVLIDFGSDTSYRGLSVDNPDDNGNYWNSLQPGLFVPNLIDIDNNGTTIDLGWDTPVATDSYNGPAGATTEEFYQDEVVNTVIDPVALGNLGGALEGPFDYAAGYNGVEHFPVRFQIQGLNPAATYDLTFYGAHSFSNDATTVYTVYSDDTYSTPVASTSLVVHLDEFTFFEPNRDRVATITGVAPQADNILYIQFVGETGFGGYLNDMQIVASAPSFAGDYNRDGRVDGGDLTTWKGDFGKVEAGLAADGDADGDADGADFLIWQRNFGAPPPAVAALGVVPEPGGLGLVAVGGLAVGGWRRSRQHLCRRIRRMMGR